MKRVFFAAVLLALSTAVSAQQLSLEQADQALSIARIAAGNEIAVKEQRIAELQKALAAAQKAAAECKPAAKDEPAK